MIKIQIKSIWGEVLFEYEKENNTLKDTLKEAVKQGANLYGANLDGANLTERTLTERLMSLIFLSPVHLMVHS